MAEPTTMLIAAALNAGGQILGGIGAKQEAELTQFQMRTQKTQKRTCNAASKLEEKSMI